MDESDEELASLQENEARELVNRPINARGDSESLVYARKDVM